MSDRPELSGNPRRAEGEGSSRASGLLPPSWSQSWSQSRSLSWPIGLTALGLLLLVLLAVWGVFRFVEDERARDLQAWQTRLGIVAESRAAAVNAWFEQRVAVEIRDLADNEALQIYMTRLAQPDAIPDPAIERAQLSYLRNLLVVTAERGGFVGPGAGADVPANIRRLGTAGIALVAMDGRVLVATPEMPPLDGVPGAFFAGLAAGQDAVLDLYRTATGSLAMGLAVPVYRVQGEARPAEQVGWVFGIRPVGADLFSLLIQPGEVHRTAETLLVRRSETMIELVSPLRDGSPPLARRFAADTDGLAEAQLAARPGGFVLARDYSGTEVLALSRTLSHLPWILISKIDRAEALADADRRRQRLLIGALLALGLIAAMGFALWRHGASRRARMAADRYAEIAGQLDAQSRLLRRVTDSQPSAITIIDAEGRYRFANAEAARLAGIAGDAMLGKSMASVLGPAAARPRLALARRVRKDGVERTETFNPDGFSAGTGPGDSLPPEPSRTVQAVYVPLAEGEARAESILCVETDITEAVTERARRERILNQLVQTLVTAVDRRDPYAAHQSERTAELAVAIAGEMGLSPEEARTVEIVGSLMNLGKILVPSQLLTKSDSLTTDEMRQVRDGLQASADLIRNIEFDGPVVESLRHLQERWDGTGKPRGLSGEAILLPARIVAVANAFVAMVSPRAYRSGISIDEALSDILSQGATAFDRRVAVALANYMDNRGGRAIWQARLS